MSIASFLPLEWTQKWTPPSQPPAAAAAVGGNLFESTVGLLLLPPLGMLLLLFLREDRPHYATVVARKHRRQRTQLIYPLCSKYGVLRARTRVRASACVCSVDWQSTNGMEWFTVTSLTVFTSLFLDCQVEKSSCLPALLSLSSYAFFPSPSPSFRPLASFFLN